MFETFGWHKTTAMQNAAHSLAQAGKAPLVIGSIAAMAVLGALTRLGFNHRGSRRATVIPARVRSAFENTISSAPRNGRRRRKRKMKTKAAAH